MLTQVYEVTDAATAKAVAAIGIDHVGAKVGDGSRPRELTVPAARVVMAALDGPARFSALFMSADIDRIDAWIGDLAPHIAHLGADVDAVRPDDLARLRDRHTGTLIMRSIPVRGPESVEVASRYRDVVDFLMLDSARSSDGKIGALGVTHDWDVSRTIVETMPCPVLLAGGLGPENVAEAIRRVRPAGVDSKTKTDVDGGHEKDLDKVRRFHQEAKSAIL